MHAELISDCFLSTIVGSFMADDQIGFFGLGDGVLVINGEMVPLGPFQGNEPPYLAYSLLETRWTSEQLSFKIHRVLNAGELDSFLIGTDSAPRPCLQSAGRGAWLHDAIADRRRGVEVIFPVGFLQLVRGR